MNCTGTHHQGCACWETARDTEIARLTSELAEARKPIWLHANNPCSALFVGGRAVAHIETVGGFLPRYRWTAGAKAGECPSLQAAMSAAADAAKEGVE